VSLTPARPGSEPGDGDRQRHARHQIQMALSFRAQGRLESAEHALDGALAVVPEHARAHRLLSVVLEEMGRLGEAERHRARADAIDPPPSLPPDGPFDLPSTAVLVLIPPPEKGPGNGSRVAGGWPGGPAVELLMRRLHTRLPAAKVLAADPENMDEVQAMLAKLAPRAVLSLRIDRAFCGDSEKDGPFSVAWLRVVAATPEKITAPPEVIHQVEMIPPPQHCLQLPLARALETALAEPGVRHALGAHDRAGETWPATTVRELFPGLSVRIAEHLERGRARLATGRVDEALDAFQAAARIDPNDFNVHAYVTEAELTLAMARELGGGRDDTDSVGELEPQLTAAERSAAERLLIEERARRDELLAALVVLDPSGRVPSAQALANLRSVVVAEPGGAGSALASSLVDGKLEVRDYFAPDGSVLARYWFLAGDPAPILREEDSDDDGRPDRWEGYEAGTRRDRWEDRRGLGRPDLHLRFAANGDVGTIEMDGDLDGRPERVFLYQQGTLASESRDTDGDGRLDRVEHFDAEGFVTRREEDLDANGEPDVQSFYERGSLVRREILNLELLDELNR
jgi:tetratricopeptide (TPR) repeat protein